MRASVVRSAAVLAVLGAVVGVVVALGLRWWDVRHAPTEFGFYSYTPLPNDVNTDNLGIEIAGPGWWALLWPGALTGLLVGLAVFAALLVTKRRLTLERAS